jgi:hypothetical protein
MSMQLTSEEQAAEDRFLRAVQSSNFIPAEGRKQRDVNELIQAGDGRDFSARRVAHDCLHIEVLHSIWTSFLFSHCTAVGSGQETALHDW